MQQPEKCVVVVGGNLTYRPYVFATAERLGLRLITIFHDEEEGAPRPGVYRQLNWKATGAQEGVEQSAAALWQALRGERIDGVVSFEDHCVPLSGRLAELLGVARCPARSLWLCRSKHDTYLALQQAGSPYAPRVLTVEEGADIAACAQAIGLPAILRISHGNCAIGTRLVHTVAEIATEVERLRAMTLDPRNLDDFGLFQNRMLLVEYLRGSEHDVDVVLVDGRLHFGYVTDNGATDLPFFTETCHLLPGCRPQAEQEKLLRAAVECLQALGLRSGVFNVEMRLTPQGPRLLEINPRMGGFYIREHTLSVWGYDLCEAVYAIACGLPPPAAPASPRHYLAGFSCFSSDRVDISAAPPDMVDIYLGNVPVNEYEVPVRVLCFPSPSPTGALQRALDAAPRCLGEARGAAMRAHLRTLLPTPSP